MATILVTGSTGAVGSAVVPVLKGRGHKLILPVRGPNPADRLAEKFGDVLDYQDVRCRGDITKPYAGIEADTIRQLKGQVDHIIHLAGSVKFDDSEEGQTMNVKAVANMMDLAVALGQPMFHHMSTAYVAGDCSYFTEGDIGEAPAANSYEESKRQGEKLLREWNHPKRIYRMSIMVGASETGEISGFTGYYGFFEGFHRLRENLQRKCEDNPEKMMQENIWFDDDGNLRLPLIVTCSRVARLNLIPADWLANTLASLVESDSSHLVHHLVHPDPPHVHKVIEDTLAHMGILGVACGERRKKPTNGLLGRLQKQLDRALQPFLPYVVHGCQFADGNTREALGDKYESPPDITAEVLGEMLDFAIACDFGRTRTKVAAV